MKQEEIEQTISKYVHSSTNIHSGELMNVGHNLSADYYSEILGSLFKETSSINAEINFHDALHKIRGIKQDEEYIILYKFMSFPAFEETMSSWAIKATLPHQANDPFECYPQYNDGSSGKKSSSEERLQERSSYLESSRRQLTKSHAFISLCRSMKSSIMWGHYADSCKGVCLAFILPVHRCYAEGTPHYKIEEYDLFEVKYRHTRVNKDNHSYSERETAINLINLKDKNWEYEREYRLICELSDATYVRNGIVCFHSIMKYLAGVIVGHRCEQNMEYIRQLLKLSMLKAKAAGHIFKWNVCEKDVCLSTPEEKNFSVESPQWVERCLQWRKEHTDVFFAFKSDKLSMLVDLLRNGDNNALKGMDLDEIFMHEMGVADEDDQRSKLDLSMYNGLYAKITSEELRDAYLAYSYWKLASDCQDKLSQYYMGVYFESVEQMGEAFKWYQKAAEQGHAPALTRLGRCYEKGMGVELDMDKAIECYRRADRRDYLPATTRLAHCLGNQTVPVGISRYLEIVDLYEKAADNGYAPALWLLAQSYEEGSLNLLKDEIHAAQLYLIAAEQGYAPAQWRVGRFYEQGTACMEKSEQKAIDWYSMAARQGFARARIDLGHLYERENPGRSGCKEANDQYLLAAEQILEEEIGYKKKGYRVLDCMLKDDGEWVHYLKKTAEQDRNIHAQMLLAKSYKEGIGVEKDVKRAATWYEKAAERGNTEAMVELGKLYQLEQGGDVDIQNAIKWYRKAAKKKNRRAQLLLAYLLIPQGDKEGFSALRESAESGIAEAQTYLGFCYQNGTLVDVNMDEAIKWYLRAAVQNDNQAQYHLALYLLEDKTQPEKLKEGIQWLLRSAGQGFPPAQNHLGHCYRHGIGVGKNIDKAVEWFEAAAAKGEKRAQYSLAFLYINGKQVPQNTEKGFKWLRECAEKEFAPGQALLANCYRTGKGVEEDLSKALEWYRKAANNNDKRSQFALAALLLQNNPTPEDEVEGVKWLQQSAENGLALAQGFLANCYLQGRWMEKNVTKALEWYSKAAEQGEKKAQFNLGVTYMKGEEVPRDEAKGIKWLQQSAENGFDLAQVLLAQCYLEGQGVEKDAYIARKWYLKAAEQGELKAQYNLAVLYTKGKDIPQNQKEGIKWLQRSAMNGYPPAQGFLANCYLDGFGVGKDVGKTLDWYHKSAENGEEKAQYQLALLYLRGSEIPLNETEGMKWLQQSAENGYPPAQAMLGFHYEHGKIVEENITEALVWYHKAAEQKELKSQFSLAMLYLNGEKIQGKEAEGMKWLQECANNGYAVAQGRLGLCYEKGEHGVEKNIAKAVELYQQAADQNDGIAQFFLALHYLQNETGQEKRREGIKWLLKSVANGFPLAEQYLEEQYVKDHEAS